MNFSWEIQVQKIFFPNLKVTPNPKWNLELSECGELESIIILRKGRKISCICINPSDKEIVGYAILGHPISKKAKYFFSELQRVNLYLQNGFAVVLFDFNGFGASDRIDLRYWKDAQSVVIHLKKNFPNLPFVLHGVSFGAFHILRAYKDLPQNSIVILENMSRSLYDYWKRWPMTRFLSWIFEKLPIQCFREMEVVNQFKNWSRLDIKVLAIACDNDEFTPANEMQDAISYLKNVIHFYILEDSTHLSGPSTQNEKYKNFILNQLNSLKKGLL